MSTHSKKTAGRTARSAAPAKRISRKSRKRQAQKRLMTIAAASVCVLALFGGGALLAVNALTPKAPRTAPEVEVAAPPMSLLDVPAEPAFTAAIVETAAPTRFPTAVPTAVPTAAPATPEPTPTLEPAPEAVARLTSGLSDTVFAQTAKAGADYADPQTNKLISGTKSYPGDAGALFDTAEVSEIHMGSSSEYSVLEGVTTFRGSNYRDGGAYGEIPENPSRMFVAWDKRIGGLDSWSGVGWTGQASLVRWPADVRARMNINRAKKAKDDLVEAIYATLDGHIYFLDLADGQETRKAINIGAPIKGSLAVDPRGLPLLYCGQGIYEVNGKRVKCGTRIWSLIDQKQLYFLDGQDSKAYRKWQAFDCSPLVDAATDTMITCGENGVLYKVRLNSASTASGVTISPTVDRYVYTQTSDGKLGTENSLAIYNHYAYFATNIGIIQCVDLNTMELVWCFNARDDIDASLVIEPEADGLVALYATNELDKRGSRGTCQMFKLNALTGELLWEVNSDAIYQNDENGGGSFATPAVGRQSLSDLVYFHVCRTEKSHGMLYALNKRTGETVWSKSMGHYGWSSPTCLYTPSGKGYVLVGSSDGKLRLLDGLTGAQAASVTLKGNIEGTPAVFDDMIIIGTRASHIYGIRIY